MPIDSGDTAWIMVSTGLVFLMIGGVGFLEAGLIRSKNASSIIMKVLFTAVIGLIAWFILGFTVAFGPTNGWVGALDYIALTNVTMEPLLETHTIPGYLFFLYQGMFAAITIALISGGLAERMRFGPWLVFIPIWMILIYAPLANWVWGGGWLAQLGALDFAGGIVVHLSAAFGSLASALILGRRLGFGTPSVMAGHNVPYQFLALFLLWFGWNGFNGGSALAANGIAVSAVVATNLAAAGAGLSTVLLGWAVTKKPSASLGANGPIAGLAAVTPASGYIEPWAGLVIGLIAGIVFYVGVLFFKNRLKVDDVCDVIAIHGMTCIWGTLSVAIFASPMITGSVSGLVYGSTELVGPQAVGTATGAAFGFVGTYVILRVINAVTPIRIKPDQEEIGEDISLHGEESYRLA